MYLRYSRKSPYQSTHNDAKMRSPRASFVKTVGVGVAAGSSTPAAGRVDGPSPHITTIPFSLNFIICLQLADPRTILLSQAASQVLYYFSSFSLSLVTQ